MMNWVLKAFAALAVLVVAGCSTLGVPSGPSGQALDPLRDDVANLLIAFDLPRGLGPAKGSLFTFDVATGGPAEHLRLQLVQADADMVGTSLPPPGVDRAYYLFAIAEADKLAVRAAQASAISRGVTGANVTIGVVPKLCTTQGLDPNLVTVSVLASVPGQRALLPFLDRILLAQLLQQPGSTQMPFCS
jgi:hypothetical protein